MLHAPNRVETRERWVECPTDAVRIHVEVSNPASTLLREEIDIYRFLGSDERLVGSEPLSLQSTTRSTPGSFSHSCLLWLVSKKSSLLRLPSAPHRVPAAEYSISRIDLSVGKITDRVMGRPKVPTIRDATQCLWQCTCDAVVAARPQLSMCYSIIDR